MSMRQTGSLALIRATEVMKHPPGWPVCGQPLALRTDDRKLI
jgi:hypothetical protein